MYSHVCDRRSIANAVVIGLLLGSLSHGAAAAAENGAAIDEIVDVLHAQGLIDEVQREGILMKHYAEQARAATPASVSQGALDGFEWSGDFRLRYEAFWYDTDPVNTTATEDRNRFRYRARFGFQKRINDWVKIGLRLASGSDTPDPRSRSRTFGDGDDFDNDALFIDQAWAQFDLPKLGEVESRIQVGKLSNPFRWGKGKDMIMWDGDLTPEGGALLARMKPDEGTELFFNGGVFIDDENAASNDPKLFAAQLGGSTRLGDAASAGLRLSGYEWRTLDREFVARAQARGNLSSAFDSKARIGELSGYVELAGSEAWPLLVFGTVASNFTADSAMIAGVSTDEENLAWGTGVEVGSSSEWLKLGAAFFHLEANSVVGQITDSDLFDGFTNRRGWVLYGAKQLAKGTELQLTLFDSDVIKTTAGATGPYASSIPNADRKRLQTNLFFKF